MIKQWLKRVWYFFLILAIAQAVKTGCHILVVAWHPKIIYFGYNLILIATSFFISWRVYKLTHSVVSTTLSALALLCISGVGINILSALLIIKIYFPALFTHVLQQVPIALQNGLIFAPIVILIAFIAARTAARHEELQNQKNVQ